MRVVGSSQPPAGLRKIWAVAADDVRLLDQVRQAFQASLPKAITCLRISGFRSASSSIPSFTPYRCACAGVAATIHPQPIRKQRGSVEVTETMSDTVGRESKPNKAGRTMTACSAAHAPIHTLSWSWFNGRFSDDSRGLKPEKSWRTL